MSAHILSVAEIASLSAEALRHHGASESQAVALAAGIAAAERDGVRSHGLMYLPIYCEHLSCGKVSGRRQPALSRPAPASLIVDAPFGLRPCRHRSWPSRADRHRASQWASRASPSATRIIAAFSAITPSAWRRRAGRARLHQRARLDRALGRAQGGARHQSLVARGPRRRGRRALRHRSERQHRRQERSDETRAGGRTNSGRLGLRPDGNPTSDAAAALTGTMAPAGGYKGVGAALMVEIFAACLTGANPGVWPARFREPRAGPPAPASSSSPSRPTPRRAAPSRIGWRSSSTPSAPRRRGGCRAASAARPGSQRTRGVAISEAAYTTLKTLAGIA